jgi:hypothetical protein
MNPNQASGSVNEYPNMNYQGMGGNYSNFGKIFLLYATLFLVIRIILWFCR